MRTDAPEKLTIPVSVTQHHIDRGQPADCSACPNALAVYDALTKDLDFDGASVLVSGSYTGITVWMAPGNTVHYKARTPQSARDFMDDFDSGRPSLNSRAVPFTFELKAHRDD